MNKYNQILFSSAVKNETSNIQAMTKSAANKKISIMMPAVMAGFIFATAASISIAEAAGTTVKSPDQVEQALSALLDTRKNNVDAALVAQVPTTYKSQKVTASIDSDKPDHSDKSVAELIMAGLAITNEAKSELADGKTSSNELINSETPSDYPVKDIKTESELTALQQQSRDVIEAATEVAVIAEVESTAEVLEEAVNAELDVQAESAEEPVIAEVETTAEVLEEAVNAELEVQVESAEEPVIAEVETTAEVLEQAVNAELEVQAETAEEPVIAEVEATADVVEEAVSAELEVQAETAEEPVIAEVEAVTEEPEEEVVSETKEEKEAKEASSKTVVAKVEPAPKETTESELPALPKAVVASEVPALPAIAKNSQTAKPEKENKASPAVEKNNDADESYSMIDVGESAEEADLEGLADSNTELFAASESSETVREQEENVEDELEAKVEVAVRAAGCPETFNQVSIPVNGKLCQIFAADYPASMILFIPQTPEEVLDYYLSSSDKFVEPKTIKQRTMIKSADNNTTLIISKDGGGTQVDILVKAPIG